MEQQGKVDALCQPHTLPCPASRLPAHAKMESATDILFTES
jgi:hypothetical protein